MLVPSDYSEQGIVSWKKCATVKSYQLPYLSDIAEMNSKHILNWACKLSKATKMHNFGSTAEVIK